LETEVVQLKTHCRHIGLLIVPGPYKRCCHLGIDVRRISHVIHKLLEEPDKPNLILAMWRDIVRRSASELFPTTKGRWDDLTLQGGWLEFTVIRKVVIRED
jgi:hypothetical protein